MFSKSKDISVAVGKKSYIPSIISDGLVITGDLVSEGELQVDGKIDGDIKCQAIIIGVTGSVKGVITAEIAKIHGALTGEISARNVLLGSSAKVMGDVTHESLAIEPGAYIEGHCMRIETSPKDTVKDIKSQPKEQPKEKENK